MPNVLRLIDHIAKSRGGRFKTLKSSSFRVKDFNSLFYYLVQSDFQSEVDKQMGGPSSNPEAGDLFWGNSNLISYIFLALGTVPGTWYWVLTLGIY